MSESQKEVGIISNLILNERIRSLVENLEYCKDSKNSSYLIKQLYEVLSGVESLLEIEYSNIDNLKLIKPIVRRRPTSSKQEHDLLELISTLIEMHQERFSYINNTLLEGLIDQYKMASSFNQNNQIRTHEPVLLFRYSIYSYGQRMEFMSAGVDVTSVDQSEYLYFDFMPFNMEYFEPSIYHEAILMLYRGLINFQNAVEKDLTLVKGKTKLKGVTNETMAKFISKFGGELRKIRIEGTEYYQVEFDLNDLGQAIEKFKQMKFKSHGRSHKPYLTLDDLWDIYLR